MRVSAYDISERMSTTERDATVVAEAFERGDHDLRQLSALVDHVPLRRDVQADFAVREALRGARRVEVDGALEGVETSPRDAVAVLALRKRCAR